MVVQHHICDEVRMDTVLQRGGSPRGGGPRTKARAAGPVRTSRAKHEGTRSCGVETLKTCKRNFGIHNRINVIPS